MPITRYRQMLYLTFRMNGLDLKLDLRSALCLLKPWLSFLAGLTSRQRRHPSPGKQIAEHFDFGALDANREMHEDQVKDKRPFHTTFVTLRYLRLEEARVRVLVTPPTQVTKQQQRFSAVSRIPVWIDSDGYGTETKNRNDQSRYASLRICLCIEERWV